MSTLIELEQKLSLAVISNLIKSYDHIPEDTFMTVVLNEYTPKQTKQKLREHIRDRYKFVSWVSFGSGSNKNIMFVKYTIHKQF